MYEYQKLKDYFTQLKEQEIDLSFSQFEDIIGKKLVDSAILYESYWNSSKTHTITNAWEEAGYIINKNKLPLKKQVDKKVISFIKKTTYISEIIDALYNLDGEASLKEITSYIEKKGVLPYITTNENWKRRVSASLQECCSLTKSYTGYKDIFYSVEGLGSGFWGLKSNTDFNDGNETIGMIRPYEKRIIDCVNDDKSIPDTEKIAIIKARVGQGKYRDKLLDKYTGCIVTGIKDARLLIASHIKPWSKCDNNADKVAVDNGLLLTPMYDRLFDSGLITFRKNGIINISNKLEKEDCSKINIITDFAYDLKANKQMSIYLEYHNDVIFLK